MANLCSVLLCSVLLCSVLLCSVLPCGGSASLRRSASAVNTPLRPSASAVNTPLRPSASAGGAGGGAGEAAGDGVLTAESCDGVDAQHAPQFTPSAQAAAARSCLSATKRCSFDLISEGTPG